MTLWRSVVGESSVSVSDSWCRSYTVRETACSVDVKLLDHYIFKGIVVYIPRSGNVTQAMSKIRDTPSLASSNM